MSQQVLQVIFAPILAILSFAYSFVMKARAWFYHVGVLPSESSGAFVISIGNLQSGGTGKTPVTDFFARRWGRELRLGIVSRGYGRKTTGSFRVDPAIEGAAGKFGDEPTWLAQRGFAVQVGERRVQAAQDLIASEGLKLVLLDDGFQHLALRRSFDIVLVDPTAPGWHWRVLPWGRLREPLKALRRADVLIITKTESLSDETLLRFERHILRWAGSSRRYFDGKTRPLPVVRFRQDLSWDGESEGEKMVLAAGLANPSAFFQKVRNGKLRPQVVSEVSYADHHSYTDDDVSDLKRRARDAGTNRVLVTEKDAVKLRPLWRRNLNSTESRDDVELVVSKLEVGPARESDEKQLEQIDEIILGQMRGLSRNRDQFSARVPST